VNPRLAFLLYPIVLLYIVDTSKLGRRLALPPFKHFPELEVLVTARRRDRRPIWTEARVEDPRLVRLGNIGDFRESGVRPDGKLVVWDTVRGEHLLGVGVEDERSDLGSSLERVETGGGSGVPKVDRSV
jgi:hypothetical protein